MTKVNRKQQLKAHQEELVNYVISQLNSGVSWKKCWTDLYRHLPYSNSTGKNYRGGNSFYLAYIAMTNGYSSCEWGTYLSWKKSGGQVIKGQKSTTILFFKPLYKENPQNGQIEFVGAVLKAFNVFNRDQVSGLAEEVKADSKPTYKNEDGILLDYVKSQDLSIKYTSFAAYSPLDDKIFLPVEFTSEARYHSTVAHEIIHSTGHQTRLNRDGVTNLVGFGSHEYSYEELIAELGSLFLCNKLELETDDSKEQSAAYLASWLKRFKSDPSWLWKASGEAMVATDFVLDSIANFQKRKEIA